MLSVISECAPLCVYGSASGGLLGSDLGELTAVLDGDVASLGKKLAIEVLTGEEPLGEVGASLGVGGGEANGVVVTGVAGDLFVGGLAIVESDDGTLHGGVVGVEKVHDAVSGPDGVGAHDVFSLSLSESSVADRVGFLNPFIQTVMIRSSTTVLVALVTSTSLQCVQGMVAVIPWPMVTETPLLVISRLEGFHRRPVS